MNLSRGVNILLILIGIVFILVIGESILVQMILAFLIWFLIRSLRTWFMKIPKIGSKIPQWLWTVVSILILSLAGILFIDIMVSNINELSKSSSVYVKNFNILSLKLENLAGVDVQSFIGGEIDSDTIRNLIGQLGNSVTSFVGNIFMITLYVMFMFSEETVFKGKLLAMFPNSKNRSEITSTLNRIGESVQSYIGLKTLVSLITAGLSYIALYFIGIDAPFFWAILIFAMNFIPTVGSLMATIFPAVMVLFQFGEFLPCVLVIGIVGGFQIIVGNIVEPKVMGKSLNLSSLVVLVALGFWTALWGVVGAVLSVPITVVLMIIFNQYESTRIISRALSEKGTLNE
jgi:predicted PurR-regulated permease PerM